VHRALATDLGFVEGPVLLESGEIAVVSMDRGCLYAITDHGTSRVIAETAIGANGATEGRDGFLFVAQSGLARGAPRPPDATGGVIVVEPGRAARWLSTDLVRPNDLCLGPDGLLYVTDPTPYTIRPGRDDGRIEIGRASCRERV